MTERGRLSPWHGAALLAIALALGAAAACTRKSSSSAAAGESDLVKRGRVVYMANCIACHASDPSKPGPLGPDVAGSSVALLEARLLEATYPAGYEPKRKSQAMPKLPHLKVEIPALAAFLNAGS